MSLYDTFKNLFSGPTITVNNRQPTPTPAVAPVPVSTTEPTIDNKELVASVLFGEGASLGEKAMRDMASTIVNRAKQLGATIPQVLSQKGPDGRYAYRGVVNSQAARYRSGNLLPSDYHAHLSAQQIADEVVNGSFKPTTNANSYTTYPFSTTGPQGIKSLENVQISRHLGNPNDLVNLGYPSTNHLLPGLTPDSPGSVIPSPKLQ